MAAEWGEVRWIRGLRVAGLSMLGLVLLPLVGCTNFFQCQDKPACPASTGTSTGTSSTVDYAYLAYTTVAGSTATAYVVGYDIASGALTQVADITLPFIPVAIAVSPNDEYLYVASVPGASSPGVYVFSISSTGSLTALNNEAPYSTDTVGAMTISPDGEYLYTLNALGATMTQYAIASSGGLSVNGTITVPSLNCAPGTAIPVTQSCSVSVSPTKSYVVASLGTAGDVVYGYASGSGITGNGAAIAQIAAGTNSGEFSVAIDGNNNAYVAETAGLTTYGLTSSTPTNRGTVSFASGAVPRGVAVDPDSKFVFTADEGTSSISVFTTGTTTALTQVSGSPFTGPADVAAIGVDSTESYVVTVGYDTNAGVQLWSLASSGVISKIASAGTTTATQYPVLVAMSH